MSKKLSGKALVIQLASDQLRIAKTNLGAAMPQLQASKVMDLPQGAVVDGVIHQYDVVLDALQLALSTPELRRVKRAVFALCTTQVIAEEATMPPVPLSKLDKMLESNMDMYFPVDTQNYHLTWQVVEQKNANGEMALHLWAVSTSIVQPYYSLANSCGLSVVAIDYCGHALASAVGASFSAPAKKKAAKPLFTRKKREETSEDELSAAAVAVAEDGAETELVLMAEPEHLLMLFVQNGQVKLQRMFLCGHDMEAELGEVVMAMDYFDTMNPGVYGNVRCTLCGSLADDARFVELARDVLNVPINVIPELSGPEWTLCLGASRTTLDFGLPALNRPNGASQINNAWQYGLILAGGAALALMMVTTLGSKAVWTTTINGLESTKQSLQIQAAQNANYAQNYYNYESAYASYSSDWDALFSALRTYNDNLVLMIDELEEVLPEQTDVLDLQTSQNLNLSSFQISDTGLTINLATPDKEQAAYTIMALRELEYADLLHISSIQKISDIYKNLHPYPTPSTIYNTPPAVETTAGTEAPPTVGSGIDYDMLMQILQSTGGTAGNSNDLLQNAINNGLITDDVLQGLLGGSGGGSEDLDPGQVEDLLQEAMKNGDISQEAILAALFDLTPEQFDELEKEYGQLPEEADDLDLDDLLDEAKLDERKQAIETMFTEDPFAVYRFFQLFKTDMKRPVREAVLDDKVYESIWENSDIVFALMSGDLEDAQEAIPGLVECLTADEDCVASTEELMQEDKKLEKRYAYYLAVVMGELDKSDKPVVDTDKIVSDMIGGEVDEDLKEVLDKLNPDIMDLLPDDVKDSLGSGDTTGTGDIDMDKLLELLGQQQGGQQSGNSGSTGLPDWLIPGFNPGASTPSAPTQPEDNRYLLTVVLGYKDSLIAAERERKGLDINAKVPALEVTK